MLKKGANLKTTRRSPAQYSTNLEMLKPGQGGSGINASNSQSRQRARNTDAKMFDANEEEKE